MKNYLIYITCTVAHKKFRDRLDAALRAGYDVLVIGYCRGCKIERSCIDSTSGVTYFLVDTPKKMGIYSRLGLLLKLIGSIIVVRIKYGRPRVILVNTAELLLLSFVLFFDKARRIYDLADIHPVQYGDGIFSKCFRLVEARILKSRKWETVVTSPWFCWGYLRPILHSDTSCYLIENKLIGRDRVSTPSFPIEIASESSLCIGWTGLLRCGESFDLLLDLCMRNKRINLDLIGVVDELNSERLALARSLGNVRMLGEYVEEELVKKLADVHFLWACDFSDGLNSRLLLPNRLYQGIFYGKPLIAEAGTATGWVVEYYGIGIVLEEFSVRNLSVCLGDISQDEYDYWRGNCISLRDKVVRGEEWRNFLHTSDKLDSKKIGDAVDVSLVLR
jgi:succinoglycan biosynthesis protein ExoL